MQETKLVGFQNMTYNQHGQWHIQHFIEIYQGLLGNHHGTSGANNRSSPRFWSTGPMLIVAACRMARSVTLQLVGEQDLRPGTAGLAARQMEGFQLAMGVSPS